MIRLEQRLAAERGVRDSVRDSLQHSESCLQNQIGCLPSPLSLLQQSIYHSATPHPSNGYPSLK